MPRALTTLVAILLLSPAFASAALTQDQIQAIVGLLQAFNADQGVISRVQEALSGSGSVTTTVTTSTTGAPTVSLIFPSSFTANQSTAFTLYGSNFQSGASVVYTGASSGTFSVASLSATQIFFTRSFPAGSYTFKVQNQGGQASTRSVSVTAGAGTGFGTNTYVYTPPATGTTNTGGTTTTCPAVTCSGSYPLKDSATNRCYNWSGGSCANKCLSAGNCLYPSYASGGCSCTYPVDFSPAYSEACIGTPQKTYQSGQTACTVITPTPANTACAAPAGWSCNINPLTLGSGLPGGYPMGVQLDMSWPRPYVFSASANTVLAFPIKFDSSVYIGSGATFVTNQFNVNTNRRDMYISDKPGSTLPLDAGNFGCRALDNAESSSIYISFKTPSIFTGPTGSLNPNFGTCFLKKDTQYWLNIKPTNPNEAMNYFMVFN